MTEISSLKTQRGEIARLLVKALAEQTELVRALIVESHCHSAYPAADSEDRFIAVKEARFRSIAGAIAVT